MPSKGRGSIKRLLQGGVAAAVLTASSFGAHAANINISVASNFYISGAAGNSPIADLIAAFQTANPGSTATVVQNGSTGTLESQITGGNSLGVDLSWRPIMLTPRIWRPTIRLLWPEARSTMRLAPSCSGAIPAA